MPRRRARTSDYLTVAVLILGTVAVVYYPWVLVGLAALAVWYWWPRPDLKLAKDGDAFYRSRKWKAARFDVIARNVQRNGRKTCEICLTTNARRWEVDHIYPRSSHPEMALDPDNLRLTCDDCNQGRGNRYVAGFQRNPRLKRAS